MRLCIELDLDNAAFFDAYEDPYPEPEVARILHQIANTISVEGRLPTYDTLRDINGSRCGVVWTTEG